MTKLKIVILSLILTVSCLAEQPAPQVEKSAEPELTQVLKTNAVELIDWAKQTAEKTGDFAAQQTPIFLQEYVSWIFWSNLSYCVFISLIAGICVISLVKFHRKSIENENEEWNNFNGYCILTIISGFLSVISLIVFFSSAPSSFGMIIKSKVAPRVLIVEKISELIKK